MTRPRALFWLPAVLAVAAAAASVPAAAGHELPFYPSFYPQEIRIETAAPAAAASLLRDNKIHAYVGGDPFAAGRVPANATPVDVFGGYVVVTFNPASTVAGSRESRCDHGLRIAKLFTAPRGAYVFHPYPVTPYHADYLAHFDLAQRMRKDYQDTVPSDRATPLKLRIKGALVESLVRPPDFEGADWDALVEEIQIDDLVAPHRTALGGWLGPPWLKEGWFHAYLLQGAAVTDADSRQAVEALYRRLVAGGYQGEVERLDVERRLVARLAAGCERMVLGYGLRREYFNSEFSEGIENIAYDSHAGFNSPIFIRTAKLKDFPWNGWLRLGVAGQPAAAWNPVGGFTDPAGRLLWAALGDPALFPAPYSSSWIGNRVTIASSAAGPGAGVEIPEDALLPEPGTGRLREVGRGKTARVKVVYRVWTSLFHDGTRMTAADAVYPFIFASRWGAGSSQKGAEREAAVEAATTGVREWLAGFKVVRVDSELRRYSDISFMFIVPIIEVYLNHALADAEQVASAAPPWSPVPWHVMVLMEEAVKRLPAAFSPDEAARRGVPWLDLVRDAKVKEVMKSVVDGFAIQAYVPAALRGLVTADDARHRWTSLQHFAQRRGHFLVTNGPYQLESWDEQAVVLQAFRDFSYPIGLGSYDRYAIPLRATVSRAVAHPGRLEIHAEVEEVQKFLRDYRILREPLKDRAAGGDARDLPLLRYVVVGAEGAVAAAGASSDVTAGIYTVDLKGRLKPGLYTVLVALYLRDNHVNPEVAVAQVRVEASP
ncbi:MAG: hypothetical protein ACT4P2_13635 [Pseudomonadota bacterium]